VSLHRLNEPQRSTKGTKDLFRSFVLFVFSSKARRRTRRRAGGGRKHQRVRVPNDARVAWLTPCPAWSRLANSCLCKPASHRVANGRERGTGCERGCDKGRLTSSSWVSYLSPVFAEGLSAALPAPAAMPMPNDLATEKHGFSPDRCPFR